jgi:uncharacterized protein YacL
VTWPGVVASGFLTERSSLGADVSLLLSILAAAMLTTGVFLARSQRFTAHRWVQTSAVGLIAVLVAFWMIQSYVRNVAPDLPGNLADRANAVTTAHAIAGAIGLTIGLIVVVRASQLTSRGADLAPYKTPMRVAYAVIMLATALGIWAYAAIYA